MIFPIISVGIFLALILILVPAMIILCLCLQTPPGRKMLPITCLHKSILIPKRFIGKGIIERNRPWKSPAGIEVVTLHIQFAVILESMIKGSFALPGIDAGVVTFLFRHVFPIDQRERVITVRPHITGIYRHACTAAQFLPPAQRGADHAERPSAHPCLKSGIAPVIKMRFSVSMPSTPADAYKRADCNKSSDCPMASESMETLSSEKRPISICLPDNCSPPPRHN